MMNSQIPSRYAQALFDLSLQEGILYPVYISLQEINVVALQKDEFRSFIANPLFSTQERAHIIEQVFKNRVPGLLYKFLLLLNLKNRFYLLSEIFKNFDELYLEKNRQMRVQLESAFELEESHKQNIQKHLGQKYDKKVSLDYKVRKEFLGGFRLLMQGLLFDSTIKSQLEQFRHKVLV